MRNEIMKKGTSDPRFIDLVDLKERRIKPLISLRIKDMPEIDIIGELIKEDDIDYFYVSNLYLAIPVQNPGDPNVSLGLRIYWVMRSARYWVKLCLIACLKKKE